MVKKMPSRTVTTDSDVDSQTDDTTNVDNVEEQEKPEESVEEEEHVTDYEEEEEDTDGQPNIMWTGYGKRTPVIIFKPEALVAKTKDHKLAAEKHNMTYKMINTESKLVRAILHSHGFKEVHPNSNEFNLMWTGSHLKPYTIRGAQEFQRVNHFPRCYEITRKDRLYKNVQRMQQTKGFRNFDFVAHSFILPQEFREFCSAFLKDKGPWIVKPVASSRGRGIFLINHPDQVPLDIKVIVCKYLANPLLIDGFKFDLRLYVAVTSFDPLVVYLYEEGLVRFATVRYEKHNVRNIRNQCMHLTNYSVNKKNSKYVKNADPDVEDYGSKWSLGALLRYLRSQGRDTTALMMRIEDVIIKTLVASELPISTACKMFMPYRGNCFEIFGFDILLDDNLRPWVLEVNLSPSLACDLPLDLKIKSNLISDLFSLTGIVCHDPLVKTTPTQRRYQDVIAANGRRAQSAKARYSPACNNMRGRPATAANGRLSYTNARSNANAAQASGTGLTGEEIRIVRRYKEEYARRGGFVRIFPTPDTWELYGSYFESTSNHNFMLYSQLFPDRARSLSAKPSSAPLSSHIAKTKSIQLHSLSHPQIQLSRQMETSMTHVWSRCLQYERKLCAIGQKQQRDNLPLRREMPEGEAVTPCPCPNGSQSGTIVQGLPEGTASKENQDPAPESHQPPAVKLPERKQEPSPAPRQQQPVAKPAPSKSSLNVVNLLEKGATLSKVQARFAFATYLTRVQERLVAETNVPESGDAKSANEQMDLVLRFLKRAAGNLQQSFKVIVPSHKLLLSDRRRILAKQLGEFVQIYGKETDQLKQRTLLDKKLLKRPPSFSRSDGLDEDRFSSFVHRASEMELEEVLTTFTKLNKSASIFLGSNAKSTYDASSVSQAITDSQLARRRDSENNSSKMHTINNNNTLKSYPQAVQIYSASAKVGSNSKARPLSATAHNRSIASSSKSRPMSAAVPMLTRSTSMQSTNLERERPDGEESEAMHHEEESINVALQRIASRQQQRKYASSSVLASDVPHHRQRTMSWNEEGVRTRSQKEVVSTIIGREQRSRSTQRPLTASETFNNFIGHDGDGHSRDLAAQSRALLQQSKAKHQAMIAQVHAAYQSSLSDDESGHLPKPPPKPPSDRKPSSAHRLARTTQSSLDDPQTFYNNFRYDSQRGTTRLRLPPDQPVQG